MYRFIDHLMHPVLVLLVAAATVGVIWLHVRLPENQKKEADFTAAIVSGLGIVYTVLLTVQTRRSASAARFAERWNALDFSTARREVGEAIRGKKHLDQVDRLHLVQVLNFFEEMAISIDSGEAQEPILKKFFLGVVVDGAETFRGWIKAEQAKSNPALFKEFLRMADR